ncbi:MAG: DUF1015 domain-containing protein [Candidatus Omnitrophota bacterium]
MAEIKPFRGLLYSSEKIGGDYSTVMAPPYDVISDKERDELYKKNEYNIIRLILGKSFETNGETDNKYTRAGKMLAEWQKEGILAKDDKRSFYVCRQEYEHEGTILKRLGFIGLMEISDDVLPHEHTLAKPKKDRMELIKQVKSNLSPIFSLYEDEDGKISDILEKGISKSDPLIDVKADGVRHMVWKFSDEQGVEEISRFMNKKKTFIADGHHRYEVARLYRDLCRQDEAYTGRADHIMMYFTDLNDTDNLTVVATHRVIKEMPRKDKADTIKKLKEYFDAETCDDMDSLSGRLKEHVGTDNVFGYIDDNGYLFFKPKNVEALLSLITEERSPEWKKMDVSVLHSAVFSKILSVNSGEGNITYVKTPEEAEALVKDQSHQAAFLLNPTRVAQLKAVAEKGEMMPQKSTYFYPKLLSGPVINKFGE